MGKQPSSNNNGLDLDIVQQQMLNGFASLRRNNPKQKMFTLAAVSDEVRRQSSLKVVLSLKQMAEGKRPMMEQGLIEDLGCGYDITEYGLRTHKEMNRLAA